MSIGVVVVVVVVVVCVTSHGPDDEPMSSKNVAHKCEIKQLYGLMKAVELNVV
jgi:hypothetical protein